MLVIAALVIGTSLPYAELIKSVDEQPNAGPTVELDGEPVLGPFDGIFFRRSVSQAPCFQYGVRKLTDSIVANALK